MGLFSTCITYVPNFSDQLRGWVVYTGVFWILKWAAAYGVSQVALLL